MSLEGIEKRVTQLERVEEAIHNLLLLQGLRNKAEFDSIKASLSALEASDLHLAQEVHSLKAEVASFKTELSSLKTEVSAFPRVMAEMLDERERRRT